MEGLCLRKDENWNFQIQGFYFLFFQIQARHLINLDKAINVILVQKKQKKSGPGKTKELYVELFYIMSPCLINAYKNSQLYFVEI